MAEKNTKNVQRQQTAPAMRQLHGIPPRHGKRGKSTHQGRRQRTEWARSMRVEAPCSSRTAETRGVRSSRASETSAVAAEQRHWISRVWRSSPQDSSCWEGPKGSRKGVQGRTGFERLLTLLTRFVVLMSVRKREMKGQHPGLFCNCSILFPLVFALPSTYIWRTLRLFYLRPSFLRSPSSNSSIACCALRRLRAGSHVISHSG